jgi:hypothetical protein
MNSKQRRRIRREFPYHAHIKYYKFTESELVNIHKLDEIYDWCVQAVAKSDYMFAESYGNIFVSFKHEHDKVLFLLRWS